MAVGARQSHARAPRAGAVWARCDGSSCRTRPRHTWGTWPHALGAAAGVCPTWGWLWGFRGVARGWV